MALCFTQSAFAAAQSIVINGVEAEIPADMGEILEQDDRTFVPIRFVSESMNKTVKYDDNLSAAIILEGADMYIVQEGSYNIYKISDMGETVVTPMDTAAFIKQYEGVGGRMYIPLRFLSEAFGYTVGWERGNRDSYHRRSRKIVRLILEQYHGFVILLFSLRKRHGKLLKIPIDISHGL